MTLTCAEQVMPALRGKEVLQMRNLKTAAEVLAEVLAEEVAAPPDEKAQQAVLDEVVQQWRPLFVGDGIEATFEWSPWSGNTLNMEFALQPHQHGDRMKTRLSVTLVKKCAFFHKRFPPNTTAERVVIVLLGQLGWNKLGFRTVTYRGAHPRDVYELAKQFGDFMAVVMINPGP